MTKEIGDSTLMDTWAADGAIQTPDLTKINVGWLSGERPAFQYMNYLQNIFGQKINHILQNGIPAWNDTTTYAAGNAVLSGGMVYISLAENTDSEPAYNNSDWQPIKAKDNTDSSDPTTANDNTQGYSFGSKWYNTSSAECWLCVDAATGAAVWIIITIDAEDLGALAFEDNISADDIVGGLPYPLGYLSGGVLANSSGDSAHDIDIAALACRDTGDSVNITLAAITKRIDATWAAGTNQGGRSSSVALANTTWYHVFAVVIGGSADIIFDTDEDCANGIADHSVTAYRRLGSVLTDNSANILSFVQRGDLFLWTASIEDVNVTNPGNSAVTRTLSVPPAVGVIAKVIGRIYDAAAYGNNWGFILSSLLVADEVPTAYNATSFNSHVDAMAASATVTGSSVTVQDILTNGASQIRSRIAGSDANIRMNIRTQGWTDERGK